MKDPDGHPLIPFRPVDPLRHKPAWAVYKIAPDSFVAERQSDFSLIAAAKAKVDALNANRPEGDYFRVFRLASAAEKDPTVFNAKPRWWE
jgi:hypothetical protein